MKNELYLGDDAPRRNTALDTGLRRLAWSDDDPASDVRDVDGQSRGRKPSLDDLDRRGT